MCYHTAGRWRLFETAEADDVLDAQYLTHVEAFGLAPEAGFCQAGGGGGIEGHWNLAMPDISPIRDFVAGASALIAE